MEEAEAPLISVIVPIYNVEGYVRKCLDSLENQSFKQIEVICVDDGSTDRSGRIAEEYKNKSIWPRFRIIHHNQNKGLSAARNTGIEESKAECIMFVDSDDWVDKDFCRIPFEVAIEKSADMVIFNACEVKKNKKKCTCSKTIGILDEFTTHEQYGTTVWNRLYHKRLYDGICYPKRPIYEDVATTHKLIHAAERIIVVQDCLYYHNWRKDSISNTHTSVNRKAGAISAFERYCDLHKYGYPEHKLISVGYSAAIAILTNTTPEDTELYSNATELLKSKKGIPGALSYKKKLACLIWKMNPQVFTFICRAIGRI